jgi:hypothetical protein
MENAAKGTAQRPAASFNGHAIIVQARARRAAGPGRDVQGARVCGKPAGRNDNRALCATRERQGGGRSAKLGRRWQLACGGGEAGATGDQLDGAATNGARTCALKAVLGGGGPFLGVAGRRPTGRQHWPRAAPSRGPRADETECSS